MKRVKINMFKSWNFVIAALIGLLGYSCAQDEGDNPVEYGTFSKVRSKR